MRPDLDLPPLEKPSRDTYPATPDQARKWADTLAHIDMRDAIRRFRRGLDTINGLALEPRKRLEMFEILRPTARELLDYLARGLHMYTLPLPERGRKLFHLHIELLQELALGYEIALVSGIGSGREARNLTARGLTALAGERALAARGEIMLRSGQVYAPLLKGFWRRTHAVYAQIEATPAVERTVREPQATVAKAPEQSPHTMYKRLLLFAAAGPHGLRKAEIERVYKSLEEWALEAHLRYPDLQTDGRPGRGETNGRFAVDLTAAHAPVPWGLYTREPTNALRVLDLQRVVEVVQKRLEQTPTTKQGKDKISPDQVSAMTLRRLADVWHHRPLRDSDRITYRKPAEVEVGLFRLKARLEEERQPTGAGQGSVPEGEVDAIPDTSELSFERNENDRRRDYSGYITHPAFAQDDPTDEIWEEVARRRSRTPGYVSAQARSKRSQDGPDRDHWILEDSSKTGFRLQWAGHGSSRATVGELIAVRTGLAPPWWRIGVVRWIRFLGEANFKAGARELATQVAPASVRRTVPAVSTPMAQSHNAEGGSAALLQRGRAYNEPARLIVPAHMFEVGEKLKLHVRGRTLDIYLDALGEYSGSFSQFAISTAEAEWEIL